MVTHPVANAAEQGLTLLSGRDVMLSLWYSDSQLKNLLTSVGIEPTTSGLDLPLLCRLSYEVGQRKSGTMKVVNRGEEKVRVHMNVVPRSTMNTNGETEN